MNEYKLITDDLLLVNKILSESEGLNVYFMNGPVCLSVDNKPIAAQTILIPILEEQNNNEFITEQIIDVIHKVLDGDDVNSIYLYSYQTMCHFNTGDAEVNCGLKLRFGIDD